MVGDRSGNEGKGGGPRVMLSTSRAEGGGNTSSNLVFDEAGQSCFSAMTADDETKRASSALSSLDDLTRSRLEESLREKELLIREIHHRVKNNLQVISSLLSLQGRATASPEAQQACEESQLRIRSIALIHELLYRSESVTRIAVGEYVEKLGRKLLSTFDLSHRIALEIQSSAALLDLDHAVPFGLVVNELMTNAMKHAFPAGREGVITVRIAQEDGNRLRFMLGDNGVGLPEGIDPSTAQSLGFRLIASLVQQLDGGYSLDRCGGTTFSINFPLGR